MTLCILMSLCKSRPSQHLALAINSVVKKSTILAKVPGVCRNGWVHPTSSHLQSLAQLPTCPQPTKRLAESKAVARRSVPPKRVNCHQLQSAPELSYGPLVSYGPVHPAPEHTRPMFSCEKWCLKCTYNKRSKVGPEGLRLLMLHWWMVNKD